MSPEVGGTRSPTTLTPSRGRAASSPPSKDTETTAKSRGTADEGSEKRLGEQLERESTLKPVLYYLSKWRTEKERKVVSIDPSQLQGRYGRGILYGNDRGSGKLVFMVLSRLEQ